MTKIQMVELGWQQMRSGFYLKTEQRWDCVDSQVGWLWDIFDIHTQLSLSKLYALTSRRPSWVAEILQNINTYLLLSCHFNNYPNRLRSGRDIAMPLSVCRAYICLFYVCQCDKTKTRDRIELKLHEHVMINYSAERQSSEAYWFSVQNVTAQCHVVSLINVIRSSLDLRVQRV